MTGAFSSFSLDGYTNIITMNEPPHTSTKPTSASTPRNKPPNRYKLVFSALRTNKKVQSIDKDPKGPSKLASPSRFPKQAYYQLVLPKMTTPHSQHFNREEGVVDLPITAKKFDQSNRQDLRIDLKSFQQSDADFPFVKSEDTIQNKILFHS